MNKTRQDGLRAMNDERERESQNNKRSLKNKPTTERAFEIIASARKTMKLATKTDDEEKKTTKKLLNRKAYIQTQIRNHKNRKKGKRKQM
jgi:hypothetical protein